MSIQNPKSKTQNPKAPALLILNQMAGPLTWELAVDLGRAHTPVVVLTGHPDTLAKAAASKAAGEHPGVRVFPAMPYQRGSQRQRAASWLRYWAQAWRWVWRRPRHLPLLLFSNPPLLPWLGYLVHRLRRQPYAVMVHDVFPDALVDLGTMRANHPVVRLWLAMNRRAYENAAVVMTLGEQMAARLERQFDPARTPAGRIEVIYPWADTEFLQPRPKAENWFAQQHGQVGKLTVMYSGNMGLGHDIETMLAAAARLRDEPDIHFLFIGAGLKWELVETTVREQQLDNVTLLGWQDEPTLPYSLATADMAMVSLDEGGEGISFPSKAITAMAAGSALLGLSRHPSDLSLLIERYQCGLNLEPGDVDGFTAAVQRCRDDAAWLQGCREAARQAAERDLSRTVNVERVWSKIAGVIQV
jgi:colanic acid biosynthesis glycosyl transferase WcaI